MILLIYLPIMFCPKSLSCKCGHLGFAIHTKMKIFEGPYTSIVDCSWNTHKSSIVAQFRDWQGGSKTNIIYNCFNYILLLRNNDQQFEC